MKIKFKNGSSVEVIENKNNKHSKPKDFMCEYMLGIKLHWYQRLLLRLLDSKLVRWVYRFKRYGR